ncbi:hypothetical protein CKAN_01406300 [Cinnamomum micranthum f. kanehirae]|uniref:Uncharacterized protein n=1 Tax=Cinnamomum micranthum f. kanehirae TaxID=337451 RepID=A0A3S3MSC1_9MAGN|nr:hypothetical protein CKAN_01406300 [Cinnamomum micranthum f. kanehirae]
MFNFPSLHLTILEKLPHGKYPKSKRKTPKIEPNRKKGISYLHARPSYLHISRVLDTPSFSPLESGLLPDVACCDLPSRATDFKQVFLPSSRVYLGYLPLPFSSTFHEDRKAKHQISSKSFFQARGGGGERGEFWFNDRCRGWIMCVWIWMLEPVDERFHAWVLLSWEVNTDCESKMSTDSAGFGAFKHLTDKI